MTDGTLIALWAFALGLGLGTLVGIWAGGHWYRRRLRSTVERVKTRRLAARDAENTDELHRMIVELQQRDSGRVDELDLLLGSTAAAVAALVVYVWLH